MGIEANDGCFEIEERDSNCVITKYTGPQAEEVAIPEKINGKPVVEIGSYAFCECRVSSVTIPDSVTKNWKRSLFLLQSDRYQDPRWRC